MGPLQKNLNSPEFKCTTNKIDPGGPSSFNLIFANQFKMPSTVIFKWAHNNNIDPGGLGPLNLIFPTYLNRHPTTIFKWAPNNNIDSGAPGPLNLFFANQF